jgi:hypothetical protein
VGLSVLIGLLTIILSASPAWAYWVGAGAGAGAGATGRLAPPSSVTVPAGAVSDVPVSWTAGTGGVTRQGFYVTRRSGASAVAVCASSPTLLLTGTSCLDSAVPDGDYTYVVTAVYATWTAPSTASSTVTVVNPSRLAFLIQPTTGTVGEAINPSVVVRLLSAAGDPVAYAGIPITVAIGTNPSVGSLSGTTTVVTATDGTATFDNLSISRAGVGYTLVATSPGLTSATSTTFTVLPPPPLGDASSYSVLGGAGVVNTLGTNVRGDLGVAPGFVATGFGPGEGTVSGDIHLGDADAVEALADAATAYTALRGLTATTELSGTLGGQTLSPGVYHSTAALSVTGILTLNGGADDVFVIQVDAALNTAAADQVVLTGDARAANVYWVVNGAVTLGAGTLFKGTILAKGAITIGLATEVIGRAFATGAVTMANNTIRFTAALPPTLTIAGGATVVTKDTTPAISGTSNAAVGTGIKVSLGGQTLTTTVQTGGGWTVTAASLIAGSYPIVAQVRDAAGNATKASQTLVVEVNPAPLGLGSATSFSVLAGGSVTSTPSSSLSGDLGLDGVGSAIVGLPPTMGGAIHIQDATAAAAETDLLAAITDGEGRTPHTQFAGDVGGRTFHVGVHHSLAAVGLTGTVTLDGEGDSNAVFIFQINGALTAAAGCQVKLVNGAQATNVFWVVNGAAGTGALCVFNGNILARGAITLGASTNLVGRALSRAEVTLASNSVTGATPAAAARSGARSHNVVPSDGVTRSDRPSSSPGTASARAPSPSSTSPPPSSEVIPTATPEPLASTTPSTTLSAASEASTPSPGATP